MTGFDKDRWGRSFFPLWIPENLSLLTAGITQFALIWWITEETGSAFLVSLCTAAVFIPRAFLNPLLGAITDRADRRLLMAGARTAAGLTSLLLLLLFRFSSLHPASLFIALFFRSCADTMHNKALLSSISLMVPENRLNRIAGITQAAGGMIMFASPVLGALLLHHSSLNLVLTADIAGTGTAIIPLLFIPVPRPPSEKEIKKSLFPGIIDDVVETFSYLAGWSGALGMLAVSCLVNFIMQPYFSLISLIAKMTLGGGEMEFGLLGAAVGSGFFLGGLILGVWQGFRRRMVTSLAAISFAGASLLLSGFAVSRGAKDLLPLCFFLSSFFMPFCIGPMQALIQSAARPDIQGRIFSVIESTSTLFVPFSLLLAGKIYAAAGPQFWFFPGGIASLLIAAVGCGRKSVRNIEAPVRI